MKKIICSLLALFLGVQYGGAQPAKLPPGDLIEYPKGPPPIPWNYSHSFNSLYNPFSAMSLGSSKDFTPASPSAASLGLFGQIPVGNYTGAADINIPLYELKYKELSVPVSISYHTSALKPDITPGPVGLGWSLQAGGCITRVVKGNPDFQPLQIFNEVTGLRAGVDIRDMQKWSDATYLTENYLYRPFCTPENKMEPDIFYFNFNGHSGEFYVGEDNVIRTQSKQGHSYKVIINRNLWIDAGHVDIGAFHVIDEKGTIYRFMSTEITRHFRVDGDMIKTENNDWLIIPTAWYLTSIESANGYKIQFYYEETEISEISRFADVALFRIKPEDDLMAPYNFYYQNSEKEYLIRCQNLMRISTPNGEVKFSRTKASAQLYYDVHPIFYPFKVHDMKVTNKNGELLKQIDFNYTYDNKTRLKLLALNISDRDKTPYSYKFEYNPRSLPSYNSWQTDLYGFYNGKELFKDIPTEYYTGKVREDPNYINKCKVPNFEFAQAEILTKITYPTGGYTCFEYEPHDYSMEYMIPETRVKPNIDGNKTTGGIRIKKVADYENTGKILREKKYHYVKNYIGGGTASSGVLGYTPQFVEKYRSAKVWVNSNEDGGSSLSEFFHWSTNPVYSLMDTRGSHVTYSEVTVEEPEGYTTYTYKNYNNGYQDHPLLAAVCGKLLQAGVKVDLTKHDQRTSMELERGQVMSEKVYSSSKKLKKEISYTYNDDPNRFKQCIKFLRYSPTILQQTFRYTSYKIEAGYIYTYFPYLKRKVETEYLNKPITRTTEYLYDNEYNLLKQVSTTGSHNELATTTYTYAHEQQVFNAVKESMLARRLLAFPVEEEQKVNNEKILLTRSYAIGLAKDNPKMIALNEIKLRVNGSGTNPETRYTAYDAAGNPLHQETLSEGDVCYIWSYNKEYLVAKIVGATLAQVKARLGETEYARWSGLACPTDAQIAELRNKLTPLDALVTTYTYKPMVGMTSETSPNGLATYYEYDHQGRLKSVRDHQGNLVKSHDYNYQNQTQN